MKELIIIGAGGMGRTLYCNAMESIGYGEVFRIKGFLDDNAEALAGYEGYPPILGTIKDYQPCPEDVFASSLGGSARRPCIEEIIRRGGEFLELIHKTARIYQNVKLGKGNFIGAYSVLGNDAVVGDYNMIQSYTVIGHDVRIGNWNRLDTHVTVFTKEYVPNNLYHCELIPKANRFRFLDAYRDKNMLDFLLPGENVVHSILKNMNGYYYFEGKPVTEEEAKAISAGSHQLHGRSVSRAGPCTVAAGVGFSGLAE